MSSAGAEGAREAASGALRRLKPEEPPASSPRLVAPPAHPPRTRPLTSALLAQGPVQGRRSRRAVSRPRAGAERGQGPGRRKDA